MNSYSFVTATEENYISATISSVGNSVYNGIRSNYYALTKSNLPFVFPFNVSRNYTVSTSAVIDNQTEIKKIISNKELMPVAVRYIDRYGTYYVERPPFRVNVNYKNDRAASNTTEFVKDIQIWVPWTMMSIPSVFANTFDAHTIRLAYSYKPLEKKQDYYVSSLYPNSYADGRICWSNSFNSVSSLNEDKNQVKPFDLTYWHSLILNDYMMGGWNNDLYSNCLRNLLDIPFRNIQLDSNYSQEKFLKNCPLLYKLVYLSEDKSIVNQVNKICVQNFSMTNKRAQMITYQQPYSNRGQHNIRERDNFVRLIAYMSLLSLEETLQFYKELFYFYKNYMSSYLSVGFQSFSTFCKEEIREIQREAYDDDYRTGISIAAPIANYISSPKALENGDVHKSSLNSKFINIYCLIEGLTVDQDNRLSSIYNLDLHNVFDELKINHSLYFSLINFILNTEDSKLFIKLNPAKKSFSISSIDELKKIMSDTSNRIKAYVEDYEKKHAKKNVYSHKMYRVSSIKDMQTQQSAYNLFKLA